MICLHAIFAVASSNGVSKGTTMSLSVIINDTFGGTGTPKGTRFKFDSFSLVYQGQRPLSASEKAKKEAANKEGIAGGYSMLAPFDLFDLETSDSKHAQRLELMAVPYGNCPFEVRGMTFMLKRDQSKWVVIPTKPVD